MILIIKMKISDLLYLLSVGILFSLLLFMLSCSNKDKVIEQNKEINIPCDKNIYDKLIIIDQFICDDYDMKLIDDYWDILVNLTSNSTFELNFKFINNGKIIYEKNVCDDKNN